MSTTTDGAGSRARWRVTTTTSPENEKTVPGRRSSGRSRTLSFRRQSGYGWEKSPFEDDELAEHDRAGNRRVVSPTPTGNCGRSSRMEDFRWWNGMGVVGELERLAERGDAHAQYLMGRLYWDGPLLTPDSQKAKDWFTPSGRSWTPWGKLLFSDDIEMRGPR